MPTWSSKDLIRRLKKEGWELVSKVGSHAQFKHSRKKGKVTIPHPKPSLTVRTVKSIYKQAGWKWGSRS